MAITPSMRYVDPHKPRGCFYLQRRHRHVGRAIVALMVAGIGVGAVSCANATTPSSSPHASQAIAFACPRPPLRGFHLPTPSVAAGRLVGEDPQKLLLCRYAFTRRAKHPLVRVTVRKHSLIKQITTGLNSLPSIPRGAPINCPGAGEADILLLAREAKHRVEAVKVALGECRFVSNGVTQRWGLTGGSRTRRLFSLLENLTGGKAKPE